MIDFIKKYLIKLIDNKIPKAEEPQGCPELFQAFIKLIHSAMNGFFIVQWVRYFLVEKPETLAVFCFPHSSEDWSGQIVFWVSGLTAFLELSTSFGHVLILTCLPSVMNMWFFTFSVRTKLAIAVLNANWVEQVSVTCANPNSGAYTFDFEKHLFLSIVTLVSLVAAVLNLLVSAWKSNPVKKEMKMIIRPINFIAQGLFFGYSIYCWFGKFYDGSDAFFWIVFVWWVSRFIQFGYTEIRKFCRGPKEEPEEVDDPDLARPLNRGGNVELQGIQNRRQR